ncbi:MAG: alpha-L-fucosidase [Planctomycetes bacterium]|nr:alpha-L-fucosidase [Planctomycetota bacterium]
MATLPRAVLPLVLAGVGAGAPVVAQHDAARSATPLSQDDRMAWWREARFGMFVHWGLYAIPAGAWNGNTDYGEWIRTSAQIPLATYERFQQQWNPVGFDADAWARMAAAAGMKYVVITSKHHDGFCLWDSAQTDWDVGGTPSGRDILRELSDACRRYGIRFCTYHSIMDWHHPDYLPRRGWETDRPTAGADFDRFERYLHAQVTELVQRYRPAVMWFDGEWESTWNHERGLRLFELCRRLDPAMIVNNRVDVHRGGMQGFASSSEAVGDFQTPEQEIPATGVPGVDWESCMTMNRHWGWNQADTVWKSTEELLRNLIDIASKGGNYLLNVGPRADGTFPPLAVERLAQIGQWMSVNGEAIHGTAASVFDALPFGRCTVRAQGDTTRLYLHVFARPADGWLTLPGLGNEVVGAHLLASPERSLPVRRDGGDVRVALPDALPDPIATVVVVDVRGAPIVYRAPVIHAESTDFVHAVTATVASASPALVVRYTLDGSEPSPSSPRADGEIAIRSACTLRARAYHDGRPVTGIVEQAFAKVTPAPAVEVEASEPGLRRARFTSVDWNRIPGALPSPAAGDWETVPAIALGASPGEHVALWFDGYVDVPADDLYRFALASDDGSRLWIDGELVVDNDGLHAMVEKPGRKALARGLHALRVVWFNKTGGAELTLRWARPAQAFAAIPAAALRHDAQR